MMTENPPVLSAQQLAYEPYPLPGYMTVPEYARHRGVSDPAVYQAIKAQRISDAVYIDKLNRKHIDPVRADKLWDMNLSVNDVAQRERRRKEKIANGTYGYDGAKKPPRRSEDDDEVYEGDSNILEAKRKNEWIKVETNTLILEEKKGRLVDATKAQKEMFEMARMVRSNMLAIPDRLAPKLAAERDEKKVHKELRLEIRKALKELQEIIREKMEAEDD